MRYRPKSGDRDLVLMVHTDGALDEDSLEKLDPSRHGMTNAPLPEGAKINSFSLTYRELDQECR